MILQKENTMFQKKKRIVDKTLLEETRNSPCVICSRRPSEVDHIVSRGAGGDDVPENCWNLCRSCHILRHQYGLIKLMEKFPRARYFLAAHGWEVRDGRLRKK